MKLYDFLYSNFRVGGCEFKFATQDKTGAVKFHLNMPKREFGTEFWTSVGLFRVMMIVQLCEDWVDMVVDLSSFGEKTILGIETSKSDGESMVDLLDRIRLKKEYLTGMKYVTQNIDGLVMFHEEIPVQNGGGIGIWVSTGRQVVWGCHDVIGGCHKVVGSLDCYLKRGELIDSVGELTKKLRNDPLVGKIAGMTGKKISGLVAEISDVLLAK